MKIAPAQTERFLSAPPPEIAIILLYGPDTGLVRERADKLARLVSGDDPFLYSELTPSQIKDDPSRLSDDALTLSLIGGRRLVHLRNASDSVSGPLQTLLSHENIPALVLLEAEDLSPRSSLRKLAEESPRMASVPCYADDSASLARLITAQLSDAGLRANPDALEYLASYLGNDRGVTRSEIAKLITYKGQDKAPITLPEAQSAIGDSAGHDLDDLVMALADGRVGDMDRSLAHCLAEGVAAIAILRALSRHFTRLLWAADRAASSTVDQAIAALRPPLFFKDKDRFRQQLQRWSRSRLLAALQRINTAEIACKTTGNPAEILCKQLCFDLCRWAKAPNPALRRG